MAGWASSACSTSAEYTLKPPVMIMSLARSTMNRAVPPCTYPPTSGASAAWKIRHRQPNRSSRSRLSGASLRALTWAPDPRRAPGDAEYTGEPATGSLPDRIATSVPRAYAGPRQRAADPEDHRTGGGLPGPRLYRESQGPGRRRSQRNEVLTVVKSFLGNCQAKPGAISRGRVTALAVTELAESPRERISRRQIDKFAERRAQLASAALQTIPQLGYARTSLREIAQNSEFSHGVLHYYFSDKEELLTACVQQYEAACVTRYDEIVAAARSAEELRREFSAAMA